MRSTTAIIAFAVSVLGFSVAFIAPASADFIARVPEPMSALMFGAGLVGVSIVGYRRKK